MFNKIRRIPIISIFNRFIAVNDTPPLCLLSCLQALLQHFNWFPRLISAQGCFNQQFVYCGDVCLQAGCICTVWVRITIWISCVEFDLFLILIFGHRFAQRLNYYFSLMNSKLTQQIWNKNKHNLIKKHYYS